jgi:hypothetical protein
VHKWIRRHREEGPVGLEDRSSRPHEAPARTPAVVEARVLAMRAQMRRGAVYLAGELGLVASTVGRSTAVRVDHHAVLPRVALVDDQTARQLRPTR